MDIIEEIDEYQTWPGWLILALRVAIMTWFVLELRYTMMYEHNMPKLNFLLHFGASSLVWFVYLPIIALIALQISPLWRFKFLLGECYSLFFIMQAQGTCASLLFIKYQLHSPLSRFSFVANRKYVLIFIL